ncbi:MAG: SRPBCC family protein [Syntrophothermus sp.]
MANNSVKLHRIIRTTPEKLYRAFLEPDAISKWLPPNGFTCSVHSFEPKAGGSFKMSFNNFTTGKAQSFGGKFTELEPNKYIAYNDEFDDPSIPGRIQTKVKLREVSSGTELEIVQEGIPEVIPLEFCYMGWQESLDLLQKLVEPNIPD